jgi:ABC-2 type transport system permease protein
MTTFGVRLGGTRVFAATEVRVQFHEWLAVLTGTLVQSVLVVFVWVLAPSALAFAIVGAMVYSIFLIGQRLLNEAAYIRIDHKLNELYHASPLSPEAYFLGMSVGMLIAYLPPILLFVVLLEIVQPLSAFAWLVLVAVLTSVWMSSSALGYVISTLFRDMKTIWPYSSLLTNLFGIVPPVFYSLSAIPGAFRPLALIVPTSGAANLVDMVAGLEPMDLGLAVLAALALLVEAVGMLALGLYWARRSAREA